MKKIIEGFKNNKKAVVSGVLLVGGAIAGAMIAMAKGEEDEMIFDEEVELVFEPDSPEEVSEEK